MFSCKDCLHLRKFIHLVLVLKNYSVFQKSAIYNLWAKCGPTPVFV